MSTDNRRLVVGPIYNAGSFNEGAMLTNNDQFLFNEEDRSWYYWSGTYPKIVTSASSPKSDGGLGIGAWMSIGDVSLRNDLALSGGADWIDNGCLTVYKKVGTFSSGAVVSSRDQAVLGGNGFYYINNIDILPLIVSPGSQPNENWQCVGLLNAHHVWDLRNWTQQDITKDISPVLNEVLNYYPSFDPLSVSSRAKPEILLPPGMVYMRSPVIIKNYNKGSFFKIRGGNETWLMLTGEFEYAFEIEGEFVFFSDFRVFDADVQTNSKKILVKHTPYPGRADCDATFENIHSGLKYIHHVHGRGSQFINCRLAYGGSLARISNPAGFVPGTGSAVNDISTAMRRFTALNTNVDGGYCLFSIDEEGEALNYINELSVNGVYGHTLDRLIDGGHLRNILISNVNVVNSFPLCGIRVNSIKGADISLTSIRGYNVNTPPSGGTRMAHFLMVGDNATIEEICSDITLSGVISSIGETLINCKGVFGNINISGLVMPHAYESSGSSTGVLLIASGMSPNCKIRFSASSINANRGAKINTFKICAQTLEPYIDAAGLTITNLPFTPNIKYTTFVPTARLSNDEPVELTNYFGRLRQIVDGVYLIELGFSFTSLGGNSQVRIGGIPVSATTSGSISQSYPGRVISGIQSKIFDNQVSATIVGNELLLWRGSNIALLGSDLASGLSLSFSFLVSTY